MVHEAYVSFEVAKLLNEKGFLKGVDLRLIPNLAFYDNIGLQYNIARWYDSLIQDKIDFVVAPTHQMAMKWLREVYDIFIDIGYDDLDWYWLIESISKNIPIEDRPKLIKNGTACHKTYEEAVEAALKYTLENLI